VCGIPLAQRAPEEEPSGIREESGRRSDFDAGARLPDPEELSFPEELDEGVGLGRLGDQDTHSGTIPHKLPHPVDDEEAATHPSTVPLKPRTDTVV
jgi:hypothetical protein